mmetsp:Transcript_118464/g.204933  ORF Transcript_118464/g.204933 Transcript_118464/m.204933 type:complete len:212 (+) Transcript_118464:86-721(+)
MADEEEMTFDFGEKKKKKSSKKKEKKEDKEDKEEKDEEGGSATVEWTRGPLYEYEELLSRMYQIIEDKNPTLGTTKKYTLKPPQIVRSGSKKTGWVNFVEICEMMKRPVEHVTQFVLAEFGTEGSHAEGGQLILKGRFQPKHAESLLRKYIKEFVTCEMCKSANTQLQRDSSTRLYMVSCENCGASRSATSIKSGYHAVTRADRRAAKNAM